MVEVSHFNLCALKKPSEHNLYIQRLADAFLTATLALMTKKYQPFLVDEQYEE